LISPFSILAISPAASLSREAFSDDRSPNRSAIVSWVSISHSDPGLGGKIVRVPCPLTFPCLPQCCWQPRPQPGAAATATHIARLSETTEYTRRSPPQDQSISATLSGLGTSRSQTLSQTELCIHRVLQRKDCDGRPSTRLSFSQYSDREQFASRARRLWTADRRPTTEA